MVIVQRNMHAMRPLIHVFKILQLHLHYCKILINCNLTVSK
ncbi:unnamed protein product [Brugia timori]|uniref:Uncharacterized protein n=1 Tax=Brugia timori TaxID=42155 RepID=A0A0R3R3F1_9BILA|nr:unnamed protein product [Brugia timori]